jgi:hypothetical protein
MVRFISFVEIDENRNLLRSHSRPGYSISVGLAAMAHALLPDWQKTCLKASVRNGEMVMSEPVIEAGMAAPGEYAPAGEAQGIAQTFSQGDIAAAFGVSPDRVAAAMQGELGLAPEARVDSMQAQDLAEALLVDEPLDARQAALMTLGAFTPRADHDWGVGETAPGEESDKVEDKTGDVSQPAL